MYFNSSVKQKSACVTLLILRLYGVFNEKSRPVNTGRKKEMSAGLFNNRRNTTAHAIYTFSKHIKLNID